MDSKPKKLKFTRSREHTDSDGSSVSDANSEKPRRHSADELGSFGADLASDEAKKRPQSRWWFNNGRDSHRNMRLESSASGWTNQKHGSFLNNIEAEFTRNLQLGLAGCEPAVDSTPKDHHMTKLDSIQQQHAVRIRPAAAAAELPASAEVIKNPWVQHFKTRRSEFQEETEAPVSTSNASRKRALEGMDETSEAVQPRPASERVWHRVPRSTASHLKKWHRFRSIRSDQWKKSKYQEELANADLALEGDFAPELDGDHIASVPRLS